MAALTVPAVHDAANARARKRLVPIPILLILLATIVVATGYAFAFGGPRLSGAGAWLLAGGNAVLVPAVMALGAPLRGRHGTLLRIALWGTFLVIFAAFGAALALPAGESAGVPLVFGFPHRAAIVLYGVGVLPLLFLPALFAWTFNARVFDAEHIQRVSGRERRAGA